MTHYGQVLRAGGAGAGGQGRALLRTQDGSPKEGQGLIPHPGIQGHSFKGLRNKAGKSPVQNWQGSLQHPCVVVCQWPAELPSPNSLRSTHQSSSTTRTNTKNVFLLTRFLNVSAKGENFSYVAHGLKKQP
jgi:hypothetical protein